MLLEPPQQLDEADVATARRLYAERGGPPSDAPQAVAILKTEKALAWRYRPPGSSIDVYASEFVVPVAPETFVAMSTSVDRLSWDDNCKALETLATAPPAELAHLHRQRLPQTSHLLRMSRTRPRSGFHDCPGAFSSS